MHCTAPTTTRPSVLEPEADPDFQHGWTCLGLLPSKGDGCEAPAPATCQGTDWPPMTSWERYAAERAAGTRVPPSVSVWRMEDVRRQAAADREARQQAPALAVVVAGSPGPSCEPLALAGRKAVG